MDNEKMDCLTRRGYVLCLFHFYVYGGGSTRKTAKFTRNFQK